MVYYLYIDSFGLQSGLLVGHHIHHVLDLSPGLRDDGDILPPFHLEHAPADPGSVSHSAIHIDVLVLLVLVSILLDLC